MSRRARIHPTAFSLVELLIVIGILALLISILMPSLTAARSEGLRLKCLSNMQAIGLAFAQYSIEDPSTYLIPVHPQAEQGWRFDGEYEYGGGASTLEGGIGGIYRDAFPPESRTLNKFLYGEVSAGMDWSLFHCPSDAGVPNAPRNFDSAIPFDVPMFEVTGTSYRINNHIQMYTDEYFYGPYMRKSTRIPESSSTVVLEETIAEAAIYNPPPYIAPGWHMKPMRYNVSFADGHGAIINIQGGNEPPRAQFDGYWVFRGEGWRLDCYPEPPIFDRARPVPTGDSDHSNDVDDVGQ